MTSTAVIKRKCTTYITSALFLSLTLVTVQTNYPSLLSIHRPIHAQHSTPTFADSFPDPFRVTITGGVPSGSVWTGAAAAVVSPLVALLHPGVLGASFLIGSTTTSILFASHLHQEQGDKAAGKMSPVVRLGVVKAVAVLRKGLLAHQLAALVLAATGLLPIMGAVGVLTVSPLALMAGKFAGANAGTPEKLFKTKYLAVRWHVAHLLFLALGIWLDPWMPWCWNRVAGAAVGMRY